MAQNTLGYNQEFPIYNANGTPFNDLVLKKSVDDSVVMSLGDKITGDVYYIDNALAVTMQEYIVVNGVKYTLVSPPTIVREGMVSDNTQLNGMTKYSFTFYHPMYMLGNFPFADVAVTLDEQRYLSQNKTFSWIGNLFGFAEKLNANLKGTQWSVEVSISQYEQDGHTITSQWQKATKTSDVLSFDKVFVSDALKKAYDTWEIPFVISVYDGILPSGYKRLKWVRISEIHQSVSETTSPFWLFIYNLASVSEDNRKVHYCKVFKDDTLLFHLVPCSDANNNAGLYDVVEGVFYGSTQEVTFVGGDVIGENKKFNITFGLSTNKIYDENGNEYVFKFGKGLGLKNNSRTPRNNKIVTRIAGYGSENNVPYGYPQIIWYGDQRWDYTEYEGSVINYDSEGKVTNTPKPTAYPIYKGIVGGAYVKLIKHPFTRNHLMPSIYSQTVFNKVSPYLSNGQTNPSYSPDIEIKDYYDAIATQEYPYVNEINPKAPSYESHEFEDIKPEFDSSESMGIVSAIPLNADLTPADHWDDSMDDDGNYLQSYFQITLPQLSFDLYACAAITQEMQINMRSGACIGCTFTVQVDWDDYKANFYDSDGNFLPDGEQRNLEKYPKSNLGQINVIVQKDNSTFGTLMPNIYQQPTANDLFVFIGISLPLSYITSAEERLDGAMKTYMLENNIYYFDYPLKFDEFFLATHKNILEQIRPNSIIHFEFGGVEQQLFVKQLTIKYGNSTLPQYDITLTDNIEVVLNQIGQTVEMFKAISGELDFMQRNVQTIQGDVERNSKHGKINRFYYYAQEWEDDDEIVYVVNQLQAPYFFYQYEYWIFNPSKNGAYSMHDMGEPKESANGILGWEKMTAEFKYIITKIIFSENAYLGSFIINGDWMISQHGTINGQESANYTQFDPEHPNDNTGTNFIPNFAVNGNTGETYQQKAYVSGTIVSGGTGKSKWEISPDLYGTIQIPTITGYDTLGNPKVKIVYDGDANDQHKVAYGGGLSFIEQERDTDVLAGGYFKNRWDVICPDYGDGYYSFIEASPDNTEPIIFFQYNSNGNIKTLTIGLDVNGTRLSSDSWPAYNSNFSDGRVYVDANGYLKVKGQRQSSLLRATSNTQLDGNYDTIVAATTGITITLPSSPVNGQKFTIIPKSSCYLSIGNTSDRIILPDGSQLQSVNISGLKLHYMVYDAIDKYWYLNWFN